jgi:hypothetical protein
MHQVKEEDEQGRCNRNFTDLLQTYPDAPDVPARSGGDWSGHVRQTHG